MTAPGLGASGPGAAREGLVAGAGRAGRPAASDPGLRAGAARAAGAAAPGRFAEVLRERVARQALHWSRHAEARLRQAGVSLDEGDLQAIGEAVSALERRGSREGLIVYGDLALVVSVHGRTVITAARPDRLEDGVFTQIDGAAIVNPDQGAGPQRAGDGAGEAPSPWIDGSGLTFRRSIVS